MNLPFGSGTLRPGMRAVWTLVAAVAVSRIKKGGIGTAAVDPRKA